MPAKEKLAATLINHWYVVGRGMEIGRIKKRPTSKKYQDLRRVDELSEDEFDAILKAFTSYTTKHFILNVKHQLDNDATLKQHNIGVTVGSATRDGLRVDFSVQENLREIAAVRKAIAFPTQNAVIANLMDCMPALDPNYGFHCNIGLIRNGIVSSLNDIDIQFSDMLRAIKVFLNLYSAVNTRMSAEHKAEVFANRHNLMFEDVQLNDCNVTIGQISLLETDEARAARRARERLEEALRRRTQKATGVSLTNNAIQYQLNEAGVLEIEFDVITGW